MLALDYLFGFLLDWISRGLRMLDRRRIVAKASAWRRISGKTLSAEVRPSGGFSSALWAGEIQYYYVVDGEYHPGLASLLADDEAHAESLTLGWKDREIKVRCSPDDPSNSTLLLEDQDELVAAS